LTGIGVGGTTHVAGTAQAELPAGLTSEKHDVLVVGAGTAGLVATLPAKQRGAAVIALEKTSEDNSGGDCRMSDGIFFVPAEDTRQSRQAFVDDNNKVTQGRGNTPLFGVTATHAWHWATQWQNSVAE
jgi:succinate dehydrogenase/fumarate reductase flavoprotein subunit